MSFSTQDVQAVNLVKHVHEPGVHVLAETKFFGHQGDVVRVFAHLHDLVSAQRKKVRAGDAAPRRVDLGRRRLAIDARR